jgi:hypothetical protein
LTEFSWWGSTTGTIFVNSAPKTSDKKATNGNRHAMLNVIQHGVMIAKF